MRLKQNIYYILATYYFDIMPSSEQSDSERMVSIYEILRKNETIGDKIKLRPDGYCIDIKFNEYLHICIADDQIIYNNNLLHEHYFSDEELLNEINDIASGKIIFIENVRTTLIKLVPSLNLKKLTKTQYDKKRSKYFYKNHLRIYTGNCVMKRNYPAFKTFIKNRIQHKQENLFMYMYRKTFGIVKKHIDGWGPGKLLKTGAPIYEYDSVTADVVRVAAHTDDITAITDAIVEAFERVYVGKISFERLEASEIAESIFQELFEERHRFDGTHIISRAQREEDEGGGYFEFRLGTHYEVNDNLEENSLYFNDYDGYVMEIFSSFLKGLSPFYAYDMGNNMLNEQEAKTVVCRLRLFAKLLERNMCVLEAMESMRLNDPSSVKTSDELEPEFERDEEYIFPVNDWTDPMLRRTMEVLADWIEENIEEYKFIAIIGL